MDTLVSRFGARPEPKIERAVLVPMEKQNHEDHLRGRD